MRSREDLIVQTATTRRCEENEELATRVRGRRGRKKEGGERTTATRGATTRYQDLCVACVCKVVEDDSRWRTRRGEAKEERARREEGRGGRLVAVRRRRRAGCVEAVVRRHHLRAVWRRRREAELERRRGLVDETWSRHGCGRRRARRVQRERRRRAVVDVAVAARRLRHGLRRGGPAVAAVRRDRRRRGADRRRVGRVGRLAARAARARARARARRVARVGPRLRRARDELRRRRRRRDLDLVLVLLALLGRLVGLALGLAPPQPARVAERLGAGRARAPLGGLGPAAVGARALRRAGLAQDGRLGEQGLLLAQRLERFTLLAELLVGEAHCERERERGRGVSSSSRKSGGGREREEDAL